MPTDRNAIPSRAANREWIDDRLRDYIALYHGGREGGPDFWDVLDEAVLAYQRWYSQTETEKPMTTRNDGRVEAHVLRGVGAEPLIEVHVWQTGVPRPVLQLSKRQAKELIAALERELETHGKADLSLLRISEGRRVVHEWALKAQQ